MKTIITFSLSLICLAAYSQANKSLSNLTSPTKVNTHLLPGTNATFNFGSSSKKWKDAYFSGVVNTKQLKAIGGSSIAVTATSTSKYGVSASSTNSYAVYAASTNSYGVYASGSIGVYGTGSSYGLYGYGSGTYAYGSYSGSGYLGAYGSGNSYGVYGASGTEGYGVYGYSGTFGVYGYTSSTGSGTLAGVYGYNPGYGYGTAGYCVNGSGIYGYSENYVGVWGATGNSSSWAGYFAGKVYSSGGFTTSDRRLKENIEDVSSAMNIIRKLQPKMFTYRHDGNYQMLNLPTGKHYGLIAQDVEQILPDAVSDASFDTRMLSSGKQGPAIENENTHTPIAKQATAKTEKIEIKAVNYTEFIPVLIKAMQEQDARIQQQDQQIQALTQQVNDLLKNMKGGEISLNQAALQQNIPNPNNGSTRINYFLPSEAGKAQIVVYDNTGKQLKAIALSNKGNGFINLNTSQLASGTYSYSLIVDGRQIDSKKMIVTK